MSNIKPLTNIISETIFQVSKQSRILFDYIDLTINHYTT